MLILSSPKTSVTSRRVVTIAIRAAEGYLDLNRNAWQRSRVSGYQGWHGSTGR